VHHKCSDTDGDPHNSNRGFWFSQIGWLVQKQHPDFLKERETLNFSDLDDDPLIRIQAKLVIVQLLFAFKANGSHYYTYTYVLDTFQVLLDDLGPTLGIHNSNVHYALPLATILIQ
jgi:fatty-acid desaturase